MMILYRGSVKDVVGPVEAAGHRGVVFEYSDSYSVFDWGRMPDHLPGKSEALALTAASFFEKLEKPEFWKTYSKSPDALLLRKGNRFGSTFNEMGEELQSRGLRTHYLGVLDHSPFQASPQSSDMKSGHFNGGFETVSPLRLDQMDKTAKRLVVKQVQAIRPVFSQVLGRAVPDYTQTRASESPRLIPLEFVFRFGAPAGSSLLDRVQNPEVAQSLGLGQVTEGAKWDFPVLELFTKLEPSDRWLSFSEALAISGLSGPQLQDILLKTSWIAGFLRGSFAQLGLELADGKLEWALGPDGSCFLVDAIGLDELRVMHGNLQLSKEFLRGFYRKTPWYGSIQKAKDHAQKLGHAEWKRWVSESPPVLPAHYRDLATQIYLSLTNELTGRAWFPQAWPLNEVLRQLQQVAEETRP